MVRGGTSNPLPKHKAHDTLPAYVDAGAQLHRKAQDQRLLPSLLGDQRSLLTRASREETSVSHTPY